MIIQPSRRQRRADPRPLHLRLARSRLMHRRLLTLAAAALIASVVGWFLGLRLELHLALMVVAALVSLLYPLRGNLEWALAWIEAQAGLSYRTALELQGDDPYGFAEAVRAQAHARALRVEAPALQPWWLPLLLLAFAFAFLPHLGLPGGLVRTPLSNPQTITPGTPPPTPQTPVALPDDATTPPDAADPPPPEGQDAAPGTPPDPGLSRDYDTPGSRQEASGDAPAGEDALTRFLESLAEPPPPPPPPPPPEGGGAQPGGSPNPFSPVSDPSDSEEGAEPSDDAQTTPGEGEGEESTEAEAPPEPGEGEPGEPQEEESDGSGSGQEEGDEAPGDDSGEGESGEEGQHPGGAGDGTGDEEGSPEASDGTAEGAGSTPSVALPTDALEGEPEGPPELLTGVRQEGPVSRAGETLMPGSEEDTVLPPGAAPDEFSRSVERAIAEGRIPVEYQEILRNYFR